MLRRGRFSVIAALIPAIALANPDYAELCGQMLSNDLPQIANNMPGLEARQFAQLHLAGYFQALKTPEAEAQADRLLDAAFETTLQIVDQEQDRNRRKDNPVEDDLVDRFLRYTYRHKNDERYRSLLNDRLESINSLHELSPAVLKLVRDLDMPIFKSDEYFDRLARRRDGGRISFTRAIETADHLRTHLKKREPSGEYDPKIAALDGLALGLSQSFVSVPVGDTSEDHLVMRSGGAESVRFVKEILERNGRQDQASRLDEWMKQKGSVEDAVLNSAEHRKNRASADAVSAARRRIETLLSQAGDNPAWAAGKAWEQTLGLQPSNADDQRAGIVKRLIKLGQIDLAQSYANAIEDPMNGYIVQRDLAQAFESAGKHQEADAAIFRARVALGNVRDREHDLAAMWRETIDLEIDRKPDQAWNQALPAAIHSLNTTFSDPYWDARKFAEVHRRRALETILGYAVHSPFDGLFATLARRDAEGRPIFDAERAMTAVASLADPTLRFGAQIAVCSEILKKREPGKTVPDVPAQAAQPEQPTASGAD
ncbi:MAG TPA: hypothetical protein VM598_10830 [Bdellovibrionota bacterium]|nr:hypothetical protein [Bdellovibrionota bacterium]